MFFYSDILNQDRKDMIFTGIQEEKSKRKRTEFQEKSRVSMLLLVQISGKCYQQQLFRFFANVKSENLDFCKSGP